MKVTNVETFLVHPQGRGKNLLFVKVSTDEGIHGWGEAYTQQDRDRSMHVGPSPDDAVPIRGGNETLASDWVTAVSSPHYGGRRPSAMLMAAAYPHPRCRYSKHDRGHLARA